MTQPVSCKHHSVFRQWDAQSQLVPLLSSQAGDAPPELTALRNRVTELEAEREENAWRVERYEELRAQNGEAHSRRHRPHWRMLLEVTLFFFPFPAQMHLKPS